MEEKYQIDGRGIKKNNFWKVVVVAGIIGVAAIAVVLLLK